MPASSTRPINKSCVGCYSVIPHDYSLRCPLNSYVKVGSLCDMVIQEILKNGQIIVDIECRGQRGITNSISLSSCLNPTIFRVTLKNVNIKHIVKGTSTHIVC